MALATEPSVAQLLRAALQRAGVASAAHASWIIGRALLRLLLSKRAKASALGRTVTLRQVILYLRSGAAAGAMYAVYRLLSKRCSALNGCEACRGAPRYCDDCEEKRLNWPYGLAAAVAVLVAWFILPPQLRVTRHKSNDALTLPLMDLALHSGVRAMEMLIRHGAAAGVVPTVPHFNVLVFQMSCAIIMSAWFYWPTALPPVYRAWITKFAAMDTRLLDALKQLRDGTVKYGRPSEILAGYCVSHGLEPWEGDPMIGQLSCKVVHPYDGMHCTLNVWRRFHRGFTMACGMYWPVHAVAQILAHRRALLQDPLRLVVHATKDTVQSSAFLGVFIASIWGTICCVRNLLADDLPIGPILGSSVCGLSLFVEKPRRRSELSCYVVPRAMQTLWALAGMNRGKPLRVLPFADLWLLCAAAAVFVMYYESPTKQAQYVRPMFRSLVAALFGAPHASHNQQDH